MRLLIVCVRQWPGLTSAGNQFTVASICATVKSLYGVSISSNTIKRNHLAHEIYKRHCATRASSVLPEAILKRISDSVPEGEKRNFWSKVARLRREPKDRLIGRLIEAEEAFNKHRITETALREEIIQLSLRAMNGASPGLAQCHAQSPSPKGRRTRYVCRANAATREPIGLHHGVANR